MKSLGAPELPNIPALPMMIVFFHSVFFILSLLPQNYYWTQAVVIINVFFFALGLWASLDQSSAQAVFWMFVFHVFGILIDIIVLGLYFGDVQSAFGGGQTTQARTFQFSAAMIIISLIFKPLTSFLLIFIFWFRDGFGKVLETLKFTPGTRNGRTGGDAPYTSIDYDGERS